MNMIQLCPNCHYRFSRQWVSLIPQIIEDPAFVFPYDPRVVTQYDVVVEFPAGLSVAPIPVMEDDGTGKWIRLGYVFTLRTLDLATLPLPHPLLLQLNVLCSRMVAMRATIGYLVILDDESDGGTVYNLLSESDDQPSYIAGKGTEAMANSRLDESGDHPECEQARDPAVVILELE